MILQQAFSKKELPEKLSEIYRDYFKIAIDTTSLIAEFIQPIIDEAFFLVEFPYVDKVFRDSYYSYFSSKLNDYPRNCIRVSVFDNPIKSDDFYSEKEHPDLRKSYCGYFVVRPTQPNIFGRTTIDRSVVKKNDFLISQTNFPTTCSGLKLFVSGFPYSSQDSETITCAETSLWSMMEYFSNRYAEYSPVLPSKIVETLKSVTFERQLPSPGLRYSDLSYALKSFGFGTRIYARSHFKAEFEPLLSSYVESGIPIIIATSNNAGIHHAFICCGREKLSQKHFDQLTGKKGVTDFDSIEKQFVFIDDNHFPYQRALLKEPCSYYSEPAWKKSRIQYFIVPLYPKIYLEAYEAKRFCEKFLKDGVGINNAVLRILLTSSRSFKNELLSNADLPDDFKKIVVSTPMPKFIWICEISNKELISKGKCYGSMILDATEPNINRFKPLLYLHLQDIILKKVNGSLTSINLQNPINEYSVYQNNLNGF